MPPLGHVFERKNIEFEIVPLTNEHRNLVIDIFNFYILNSFAAYPENPFPYEMYAVLLNMSQGYPAEAVTDNSGEVLGFGFLRGHNSIPTFSETAEVTYFIHDGHTGKGIGKILRNHLKEEGKKKGVTSILASISSLNPRSIEFHEQNGFTRCGLFQSVGKKNGKLFDTIWMQKRL